MQINDSNWALLVQAVSTMQENRRLYQEFGASRKAARSDVDKSALDELWGRVMASQADVLSAAETVTGDLLAPQPRG